MGHVNRVLSTVLLAAGVLLILRGLTLAVGMTPGGVFASVAAIAALLYAGAAWFGSSQPRPRTSDAATITVMVFDRNRRLVTGPAAGQMLASQFTGLAGAEVERRCAAALSGTPSRFPCVQGGETIVYDVLPVRSADGAVVFGMLVKADAVPARFAASA